jgi:short-subunit dehydrogenase
VKELRGANALVTGAGGGLGRYIARALAAEGVNLALSDMPSVPVDELLEELRPLGVRAEPVPADLTDTAGLEGLIERAEEVVGPIDVLVNNAGLEFSKGFDEQTRAELEAITAVNVLALMELTRAALPGMLARGRGHVVNLASLAGKLPTPYLASYSATKHAVVGFTHSLRAELGDGPVGFTAICPGFISRVGMYGRIEHMVPDVPRELGKLPPERVGEAVVDGIRSNRAEVIVNQTPARPVAMLAAAAPGLVTRLLRRERTSEFARRFGEARRGLDGDEGEAPVGAGTERETRGQGL